VQAWGDWPLKEKKTQGLNLPFALEVEQAVLGTILAWPSAAYTVGDQLRAEHFFLEAHSVVAEAILELVSENKPPEFLGVTERLKFNNKLVEAGGLDGLDILLRLAGNEQRLDEWLKILKRYWELRLVVEKCTDLAARGRRVAGASMEGFLEEAEGVFLKLAEAKLTVGLQKSSDVLKQTMLNLNDAIQNRGKGITGVPTGFLDFDEITSGFQKSDLIILAARPAMGKTALALNFATYAAVTAKRKVAFFSLEMSSTQLMQRILGMQAQVEVGKFRRGDLKEDEFDRLIQECPGLNIDGLRFDDTASISLADLRSRCRKMKNEKGLDLIVIDYLQLMTAGSALGPKTSRELEIGYISRGLKGLAKELEVPVIALAQLNRGLENRPDKRPRAADLRESGSIEQDADLVMFVYRDEVYNKDTPEKGIAELIIGKNRHGALDTVKLVFQSQYTSFHNLTKT
jgi:replicative DNA helicase